MKAAKQTGVTQLAIAGGVSANSALRERLQLSCNEQGWKAFIPKFEYSTDNAAMIAIAAYFKYLKKDFAKLNASPYARS